MESIVTIVHDCFEVNTVLYLLTLSYIQYEIHIQSF